MECFKNSLFIISLYHDNRNNIKFYDFPLKEEEFDKGVTLIFVFKFFYEVGHCPFSVLCYHVYLLVIDNPLPPEFLNMKKYLAGDLLFVFCVNT